MKYLRHIQAWLTAQYLAAFELPEQGHSAARSTAPEVTLVSDSTHSPGSEAKRLSSAVGDWENHLHSTYDLLT